MKFIVRVMLNTALYGGEWLASRSGRFATGIHCLGGSMGATAGLDVVVKSESKILDPSLNRASLL
jgi:hypothetical protein